MRVFRAFYPLLVIHALTLSAFSADEAWQAARIVDVAKNVNTQTLYWIANTPVTRDEISYRISIHLKDKILTGVYSPSTSQPAPPEEWTQERLVKTRIVGDTMYLLAMSGDEYKVRIGKRKNAPMLPEISAAELQAAYAPAKSQQEGESPIGFSKSAEDGSSPGDGSSEERAPAVETAVTGTLSTTTVPYLADVYVDGNRVGYSPTKVTLPPGKHVVRFEKQGYKPSSKEVVVEPNGDVALDVTLDKK
jgi:hypothetical protein